MAQHNDLCGMRNKRLCVTSLDREISIQEKGYYITFSVIHWLLVHKKTFLATSIQLSPQLVQDCKCGTTPFPLFRYLPRLTVCKIGKLLRHKRKTQIFIETKKSKKFNLFKN